MNSSIYRFSAILTVLVAMFSLACGSGKPGSDRGPAEFSPERLRAELDSGALQTTEEPFVVRPFNPHAGDNRWADAVSYGCYREGQAPGQKGPSEAEILEDLQIIAQYWSLIRLYGADADSRRILQVIEEHDLPLRVMLGIWLEPEEGDPERRKGNVAQVIQGIELANRYRANVVAVSVGNETQVYWSGHRMNAKNLIRHIRAVRNNVSVPVTTADDYNFWNKPESKQVAGEVDFKAVHLHPLWNGRIIEDAINWIDQMFDEVKALHPDRLVVIGETGWATDYDADRTGPGEQGTLIKGEVSVAAQGDFLIRLHEWVEVKNATTFLFEAFDEPWKGGGPGSSARDVEKHWGVFYEDRTPKESFLQFVTHRRQAPE